ncbi:MAG: hypothetical protein WCI74_03830 [Actinomycetes bacterium]
MRMYRRFAWLGLLVVALAFRAIATEGLGREHPAIDQLKDVHLPTTNTSGAA